MFKHVRPIGLYNDYLNITKYSDLYESYVSIDSFE